MRVLITGVSGFVGRCLARHLLEKTHKVFGLCRRIPSWMLQDIKDKMTWIEDDLSNVERLINIFESQKPDVIIHAAAYGVKVWQNEWEEMFRSNVVGSLNLVEAAGKFGVHRVLHIGTSQEYGSREGLITEGTPLEPQTSYGVTKTAGFYVCKQRAKEMGLHWTYLRPFLSFGPGEDRKKLFPSVIIPLTKGQTAVMTGGEQVRDIIYVKDLVEGITKTIETDLPKYTVINIGSGNGFRLKELAMHILEFFPKGRIEMGGIPYRNPEIWHQVADISLQRQLLKWEPNTPLRDAISDTIEWYRREANP